MNYKTQSDKQRQRERNSVRRTKNINGQHVIIAPGFNTSVVDIDTTRDTFTNYNGNEQTCYNLQNTPTNLDYVVARHPQYDAWYVFDKATGKQASKYGGDTREQAVIQFSQDFEHILQSENYSIDNVNQLLANHQ